MKFLDHIFKKKFQQERPVIRIGTEYGKLVAKAIASGGEFPEPPSGAQSLRPLAVISWNRTIDEMEEQYKIAIADADQLFNALSKIKRAE